MFDWFNFGKIKYNGEIYTYDIWINQDGDCLPRRPVENHHFLTAEELQGYLRQDTTTIVFGTGDPGVAKLTEEANDLINSKKLEIIAEPTPKAIKTFNSLKNKKKIAIMHLTC